MKLIFRADDLGFSEGVNYGIEKAVKEGVISSVGLMPNMEAAKQGYELIRDTGICLGQHTNICVGKPVLAPERIPSLVGEDGIFCSSSEIRKRGEDLIDIGEAEAEIEAQLQRFIELTGKKPDYFEGHAVFSRNFFKALENVAARYGLFYSNPVDQKWIQKYGIQCGRFYQLDNKGLYDPYKYVMEDEADIRKNECSVLIFHPGYLDQYILEHSSFTLIRPMETEFLCSERLKTWVVENDINIVDFNNYRDKI